MKTQYRPIAMRCTQEQFDSIKDRIPLPIWCHGYFNKKPYIVNNYFDDKMVGNVQYPISYVTDTLETFDGELFLDCCGREKDDITQEQKDAIIKEYLKDKVWDGKDLEVLDPVNKNWYVFSNYKYRIKPKPDYTKEIEALIDALVEKAKENGQKVTIKFE